MLVSQGIYEGSLLDHIEQSKVRRIMKMEEMKLHEISKELGGYFASHVVT